MATLSVEQRKAVTAKLMSDYSRIWTQMTMTAQELYAEIAAIDNTFDSTEATFYAAIPEPAKSAFTVRQHREIFNYVADARKELV